MNLMEWEVGIPGKTNVSRAGLWARFTRGRARLSVGVPDSHSLT